MADGVGQHGVQALEQRLLGFQVLDDRLDDHVGAGERGRHVHAALNLCAARSVLRLTARPLEGWPSLS